MLTLRATYSYQRKIIMLYRAMRTQSVEMSTLQGRRLPGNLWVHSGDSLERLMTWWQDVVASRGHLTSALSLTSEQPSVAQHTLRVARRRSHIDFSSASMHLLLDSTYDALRYSGAHKCSNQSESPRYVKRQLPIGNIIFYIWRGLFAFFNKTAKLI